MTTTTFESTDVGHQELLRRIYTLRAEVWQHEGVPQSVFPSGQWSDIHDQHSTHWAVFRGGELVAAARLCTHDTTAQLPEGHLFTSPAAVPPIAAFNRLVVHPDSRGLGIARALDDARIARARMLSCSAVYVTASFRPRIAALRLFGFDIVNECDHPLFGPSVAMQLTL